jgi:hypothetical protein
MKQGGRRQAARGRTAGERPFRPLTVKSMDHISLFQARDFDLLSLSVVDAEMKRRRETFGETVNLRRSLEAPETTMVWGRGGFAFLSKEKRRRQYVNGDMAPVDLDASLEQAERAHRFAADRLAEAAAALEEARARVASNDKANPDADGE